MPGPDECPNGCDLTGFGGTHQGLPDCDLQPSAPDWDRTHGFQPTRGDAVERWLKAKRDEAGDGRHTNAQLNYQWHVVDGLLDEYRLRADTGLTLADDIAEAGESGTDYATMVTNLESIVTGLDQSVREHMHTNFHDEHLGRRTGRVETAKIPCRCIHDFRTGKCQDHGYALAADFTCKCPRSL